MEDYGLLAAKPFSNPIIKTGVWMELKEKYDLCVWISYRQCFCLRVQLKSGVKVVFYPFYLFRKCEQVKNAFHGHFIKPLQFFSRAKNLKIEQ